MFPCFFRIKIKSQSGFKGRKAKFVAAQRPGKRVFIEFVNQVFFAGNNSGLRTAQGFVARKADNIRAACNDLPDCRFRGQPLLRKVQDIAAPQIINQRKVMFFRKGLEFRQLHSFMKTDYSEIRSMHCKYGFGVLVDRIPVIFQVRSVGGADLSQKGAALGHDVRNTKTSADFNQFTSRNNGFSIAAKCIENQQNGSRIVVDNKRRFRSRDAADKFFCNIVAAAAFTCCQIHLEVAVAASSHHRCFGSFPGQNGSAEVGVNDDARGV